MQSSRGKESIEKQYMLYVGTRKKITLHPMNGSHPLWDDYRASVLPCSHANMLSMPTKKARPFLLCFSNWPRGFLNGCSEITVAQMQLLTQIVTLCIVHLSCVHCCASRTPAPSATCSQSAHSHSVVTLLLLLCLQFAFWMISWGNQTLKKETLSINIFLILSSTIRGPCLNLCQSEGKIQQKQEKLWEEIKQKLFWWKQTLPFGFCFILWHDHMHDMPNILPAHFSFHQTSLT